MDTQDYRESVLIVLAGLLGGVMSKALDLAWSLPLFQSILLLGIASIIVFLLAYWIIKYLPKTKK